MVVLTHVNTHFHVSYPFELQLKIFRMPLYFFLSGLFFKKYENIVGFIKRKTNKLIIPFCFFYLVGTVALPNFLHLMGYDVRHTEVLGWKSLYVFAIPSQREFPNSPIWFLLCLFNVNLLFYFMWIISMMFKKFEVAILIILCFFLGTIGFTLGYFRIYLPFYIDTAFTAIPFFCLGFVFRRYTEILVPNKLDKYLPILIFLCLLYLCLFAVRVSYVFNRYDGSIFTIYSCGLIGTLFIIFFSKILKSLPLISYWGRYSIVILCTHNMVIQFLAIFLKKTHWNNTALCVSDLIITMMLYLLIIPFSLKYLPHVTAQKDVIKV